MGRCSLCGNEYDKCLEITCDDERRIFDCFECAITALAPTCRRCGCRVIGHGVESDGAIYCGAHCARLSGLPDARDRV